MLSMAPVGSAGGAAKYFAADNYYTLEESAEESIWYGAGAELLGLAPGEDADDQVVAPAEADTDAGEQLRADREAQAEAANALDDDVPNGDADERQAGDGTEPTAEPTVIAEADVEATGDDVTTFDPETVDGVSASPTESSAIQAEAPGDDGVPFDPDRVGGLPEGVVASPEVATGQARLAPGNLCTNPGGKVDAKTFENILNGKLPDGSQIGKPGDRRLGMDLTFSMPKSASLLAYVGGDKRILEAHMGAVKSTMRWVEANLAETRVRDNLGRNVVRTGNLVYALFQHDTSRALDPQGHIHAVIANLTRLPNGQWQSVHNGEIWRNNTVTSSIYHAAFRDALEKLGYTIEHQGKHGTFEIAGVSKAVREAFSQRREAILAKGAEIGIATPQGLREVTKNSRDAKVSVNNREALRIEWMERADALGFKHEHVIDAAKGRVAHVPGLIEIGLAGLERAIVEARAFVTDHLQKPHDPLIDRGIGRFRLSPVEARTQLAVASAIRILSQREAAFEINQVTKTALDLGLADVTPETIAARVTELIKSDQLVPGVSDRRDNLVTMVTTREALTTETAILAEIAKGKGASDPALEHARALARITTAAHARPLNDGQMGAALAILTSSDRITAVQGDAGSGKSTMLRPVADILKFEGYRVIGLAFQTKVASALREETGIAAMTVAKFLIDHRGLLAGDSAATQRSRDMLGGSYLFLDEASMIANDQMLALNRIANSAGVAALVAIGDRQQLLPIEAGKAFALSQAGGIATRQMSENLRQKTPELRAAAALSKQGRTGDALRTLGRAVHESPERMSAAASWWLALEPAQRETAALFTSGKLARADINGRIQEGLKAEGTLKGDGVVVRVNEAVDRTREEMRYAKSYEPGMTLEVWGDVRSIGLARGDYRVARVFGNGKVELAKGGKRMTFKPAELPASVKDDRLKLAVTKDVRIHEGERIRWTGNDRTRDLLNGTMSKVLRIDDGRITVEKSDNSVLTLEPGDPMLKRLDLAYALNMHMAQGMTADRGALVMGSDERFLANQRLAHVGLTRVREDLRVFTDDREKLIRQIERTSGDKTSALEVTGQLKIDAPAMAKRAEQANQQPFDPGSIADLGMPRQKSSPDPLDKLYPGLAAAEKPTPEKPTPERSIPNKSVPQLSVPEKAKGLEL
jgi:conjugative relaxase-like TrwC/TraI family protein